MDNWWWVFVANLHFGGESLLLTFILVCGSVWGASSCCSWIRSSSKQSSFWSRFWETVVVESRKWTRIRKLGNPAFPDYQKLATNQLLLRILRSPKHADNPYCQLYSSLGLKIQENTLYFEAKISYILGRRKYLIFHLLRWYGCPLF